MIWLRTRVQYPGRGRRLERAGWLYFGAALGMMALGWVVAPPLGTLIWQGAIPGARVVLRVAWFLGTYYLFIVVHQMMKARRLDLFTPGE